MNLFSGYATEQDMDTPPVPRSAKIAAGLLMLLSLLGAAWRTQQISLSVTARLAWILVCGAISLPALMSLWLLYPKREVLDELPLAHAAIA